MKITVTARTVKPEIESGDWTPEGQKRREGRWNQVGEITNRSDSHGTVYELTFKDKHKAWYEPRELILE